MNKPKTMVSMELDDEDKLDAAMPIAMPDRPDYPYGLCISLTDKEFKKLGLDMTEAEVGMIFHGHFMARIKSVSSNDSGDGQCCRVEAQIEDLAIESEDEENAENEAGETAEQEAKEREGGMPKRRRSVLYG